MRAELAIFNSQPSEILDELLYVLLKLEPSLNSGVASCACQLHTNLLFLGSWLANSLLVHVTNPQVRPPVSDTSCVNSAQTHCHLFETVLALHKLLTHPQALHTCLKPSYLHNLSRLADCVVQRAVSA